MLAASWLWILAVAACLLAAVLTAAVRKITLRHNLLDVPNGRSSHKRPTPTSAGLAIVLSFSLFSVAADRLSDDGLGRALVPLLCCSGVIAALGLLDDLRNLSARVRFLTQIAAAVAFCLWFEPLKTLSLPGWGTILLDAWALPFSVLWLVAMTNFYNFMDGIDGIAGGTAVIVGLFMACAFGTVGAPIATPLLLAAACAGFLTHNYPPARIFMGDVGSGFLGFIFAALTIIGNQALNLPATGFVLGLGMFILDTSFTLIRRIAQGERWYAAHRTHYYQRLVQAGWSHRRVDILHFTLTALCCISGYMYMQVEQPLTHLGLTAAVISLFVGFMRLVVREQELQAQPEDRDKAVTPPAPRATLS